MLWAMAQLESARWLYAESEATVLAMPQALNPRVYRQLGGPRDTDIGFRDIGIDLHFGEIIRDRENNRSLQAGRHRLAHIHISRNHYAIDRRRDRAMIQIRFGFIDDRGEPGLVSRCRTTSTE